ncbi:MAG TPA: DUF378 domain-containing protein [Chlamydiales bacterium]|nr:DUF378 domain-containing protein [Chlamydiales bacterium]
MKNNRVLDLIAVIILIIGGLNWGLIGLFEWNFIGSVFGYVTTFSRTLYTIIGIAAIYKIINFAKKGK